jgi:outer membrane immunogenic protein
LLGAISSASAADLPTKAPPYIAPVAVPPNWSGFYVGLNAGGVWSDTNMDWRLNPVGFGPSGVLVEQAAAGHLRPRALRAAVRSGSTSSSTCWCSDCSTRVCRAVEAAAQLFLPEFSTYIGGAFGDASVNFPGGEVSSNGQIGCDYQFSGGWVVGFRNMFDGTSNSTPL